MRNDFYKLLVFLAVVIVVASRYCDWHWLAMIAGLALFTNRFVYRVLGPYLQ